MTALDLRLFGPFEVRDTAGQLLLVKARKNRALLAALALAPSRTQPRTRLTGLLWSERADAQARSSLRQALRGLRSDLGDTAALRIDDDSVSLDPRHIVVDALEFQTLAASGDPADLRRADVLYRGDLLADTFIQDPIFDEWLTTERRRLADIANGVIERLCGHESGARRVDLAKRLVAADPLREAYHRILMEAYLEADEKGLALRQYELCRALLRKELQIAPGEQIEALRRRCLERHHTRDARETSSEILSPAGENVPLPNVAEARPLLAVLPFQVFDAATERQVSGDALTEDIIGGLSRVSAIRVVARSTMFTYRNRSVDIRDIGRDLGARYALEGSVRMAGQSVRVAAQLIDAMSGHHIWADRFDRSADDIYEVQNEIAGAVVASVQTQLTLNEGRIVNGDESNSVSRLLAQAWRHFLLLTRESLATCRVLAERVLEQVPENATAHRMAAIAIYHQIYMGYEPWDEQELDRLLQHARMSIESDGADEYCHWAMECAYLLKGRHELAAASLRRALEINPNFSLAQGSMATVLAWSGRHDESVERNELALRLNPQDPSNFFRHFGLALAHYLAQRPDKALAHAVVAIQARANWHLAQLVYAAGLVQAGRLADAGRVIAEIKDKHPRLGDTQIALLPFAMAVDRERFLSDLRSAGF